MAVIKVLYAATNQAVAYNGAGYQSAATAAGLKDASNATFGEGAWFGDGVTPDFGDVAEDWNVDSCPSNMEITKVTVRIKSRKSVDLAVFNAELRPRIASTNRGTPITLNTTYTDYDFDFTVDPADSQPWTPAKINAQKWGWYGTDNVAGTDANGQGHIYVTEFEIRIEGGWTATGDAADATITVPNGVGEPGDMSATGPPAEAAIEMSQLANQFIQTDERVSTDITPIGLVGSATGDPITVRARGILGNLGDENLNTYRTNTSNMSGSGTMGIASGAFGLLGDDFIGNVEGNPPISGVKFFVTGCIQKFASGSLSNMRVIVDTGVEEALSMLPIGTADPPSFPMGTVATGLVAERSPGEPWDWETIFTQLSTASFAVDYTIGIPTEFMVLVIAEAWIEIHGPIGGSFDPILVRSSVGGGFGTLSKGKNFGAFVSGGNTGGITKIGKFGSF